MWWYQKKKTPLVVLEPDTTGLVDRASNNSANQTAIIGSVQKLIPYVKKTDEVQRVKINILD